MKEVWHQTKSEEALVEAVAAWVAPYLEGYDPYLKINIEDTLHLLSGGLLEGEGLGSWITSTIALVSMERVVHLAVPKALLGYSVYGYIQPILKSLGISFYFLEGDVGDKDPEACEVVLGTYASLAKLPPSSRDILSVYGLTNRDLDQWLENGSVESLFQHYTDFCGIGLSLIPQRKDWAKRFKKKVERSLDLATWEVEQHAGDSEEALVRLLETSRGNPTVVFVEDVTTFDRNLIKGDWHVQVLSGDSIETDRRVMLEAGRMGRLTITTLETYLNLPIPLAGESKGELLQLLYPELLKLPPSYPGIESFLLEAEHQTLLPQMEVKHQQELERICLLGGIRHIYLGDAADLTVWEALQNLSSPHLIGETVSKENLTQGEMAFTKAKNDQLLRLHAFETVWHRLVGALDTLEDGESVRSLTLRQMDIKDEGALNVRIPLVEAEAVFNDLTLEDVYDDVRRRAKHYLQEEGMALNYAYPTSLDAYFDALNTFETEASALFSTLLYDVYFELPYHVSVFGGNDKWNL